MAPEVVRLTDDRPDVELREMPLLYEEPLVPDTAADRDAPA